MVVESDGSYGIPKGLMFSMPVTSSQGTLKIVRGLELEDRVVQSIQKQIQELLHERNRAQSFLSM